MKNREQYTYDLHIHSCLSPCAQEDMTPNNIVNMARLSGLQIIAVCDHNTCGNVAAVMEAGQKNGLLVVPAMELETSEEVHILCFFSRLKDALEFEKCVRSTLKPIKNRPEIFGEQVYMDSRDRVTGKEEILLLGASGISISQVASMVRELDGAAVPAHIDRASFSVLSNLGLLSEEMGFSCVELSHSCDSKALLEKHPEVGGYRQMVNSDAHSLRDMVLTHNKIFLPEFSAEKIINNLRGH